MIDGVPRLPHSATDKEIVDYVKYYYPELGPMLRQLMERMECAVNQPDPQNEIERLQHRIYDLSNEIKEYEEDTLRLVKCPHCGSTVECSYR